MMKTITHFYSSPGGARHSYAFRAMRLLLLSLLMFLPSMAMAEETEEVGCPFKYTVDNDDEVTITGFADGQEAMADLVIPATIDGKRVTAIGSQAFYKNKTITNLFIPASVKKINLSAFAYCPSLASVNIEDGSELEYIYEHAFSELPIQSISIPASVRMIYSSAFQHCTSLASVTIAEGSKLEFIGSSVFEETAITSFSIPSSVSEIYSYVFEDCPSLSTVTFGRVATKDNVAAYQPGVFNGCSSLTSIIVPGGTEEVYQALFADKASLIHGQPIHIDGLKYEMNDTKDGLICLGFVDDEAQRQLVVPEQAGACPVTAIAENAFSGTAIESVVVPSSVAMIGAHAFGDCSSLANVSFGRIALGDMIEGYQGDMFSGCDALASISVPAGSEDLYKELLADHAHLVNEQAIMEQGLKYQLNDARDGLVCVGFTADVKSELMIPTALQGFPVVGIGDQAFSGAAIKSVVIPSSVAAIGTGAFSDCPSLATVTFGRIPFLEGIEGYQGDMFSGCTALATINLPSGCEDTYKSQLSLDDRIALNGREITVGGLIYMLNEAKDGYECRGFSGDSWSKLVIPSQVGAYPVTSISSFNGTAIESVFIPASVKTIESGAFGTCSSLTTVTFEEGSQLACIKGMAFANTAIKSICIPASVKETWGYVFMRCSSLTTVTFERILLNEEGAAYELNQFEGCSALSSIFVPSGSEEAYFGKIGIDYCQFVKSLPITAKGLQFEVNEAKDGLTCTGFSVKKPDSHETEDSQATEDYQNNEVAQADIVIPAEVGACPVTGIGENAFSQTALERISLPSSIKAIASNAFADASALKCIIVDDADYERYKDLAFEGNGKLVIMGEKQQLLDARGIASIIRPTLYEAGTLSYQRTVDAEDDYATLCLPFDIDLGKTNGAFEKVYIPMNSLIHNLAKSTGGQEHFVLMLKKQAQDAIIPAGQPMFVKLAEGNDEINLTNAAYQVLDGNAQPQALPMTVVDWDGTSGLMEENTEYRISYGSSYQPLLAGETTGLWTFNGNGTFGPHAADASLNPFRLFLHVSQEGNDQALTSRSISISIGVGDGTTTGIQEIISSSDTIGTAGLSKHDGIIYDLNGRKVTTADKANSLPKGIYIQDGKKRVIN